MSQPQDFLGDFRPSEVDSETILVSSLEALFFFMTVYGSSPDMSDRGCRFIYVAILQMCYIIYTTI